MEAHAPAASRWSRRLSAALCVGLLVGFAWLVTKQTQGFEVWTFEGQRRAQIAAGTLHAAPASLRTADATVPTPWQPGSQPPPGAYLVDFIYTRCPTVCRVLGSEYQQMQAQLAERGNEAVQLLSVSFDIANDDAASLRLYGRTYQADPARWTIAAPTSEAETRSLLQSLGVVVIPDGFGGYVHNGAIHLLDERGRLHGLYELDEWQQALAAAEHLAATRREARR